jgi:hypothetical protein
MSVSARVMTIVNEVGSRENGDVTFMTVVVMVIVLRGCCWRWAGDVREWGVVLWARHRCQVREP